MEKSPIEGRTQSKSGKTESGNSKEDSAQLIAQNRKDYDTIDCGKVQPEKHINAGLDVEQSGQQLSSGNNLDTQPRPLTADDANEILADMSHDASTNVDSLFGDDVNDETFPEELHKEVAILDNHDTPDSTVFVGQTGLEASDCTSNERKRPEHDVQVIDLTEEGS